MLATIGAASSKLAGADPAQSVLLKNVTGSGVVYLEITNASEALAATAAASYPWAVTDGQIGLNLPAGAILNAISPSGNQTIAVLRGGH